MLADRVRMGSRKKKGENEYIGEVYLAQDSDFMKFGNYWVYLGSELEIEIPHRIQGEEVTSYNSMFVNLYPLYSATPVTRVDSNNKNITDMSFMFQRLSSTTLDLSLFDTSNVTNMEGMFDSTYVTSLDLSSFDTSNVTDMSYMFAYSQATSLDLSSFNTSNVTDMRYMFYNSQATLLDLSSFDTSNVTVTNMNNMFQNASATIGYARTQADADKFNASSGKPSGLVFVVK